MWPAPNGLEASRQEVERGYEGYVAKDEASAYKGRGTALVNSPARFLQIRAPHDGTA